MKDSCIFSQDLPRWRDPESMNRILLFHNYTTLDPMRHHTATDRLYGKNQDQENHYILCYTSDRMS